MWITDNLPKGNGTYTITVEQHKHDKLTGKDVHSRYSALAEVEVYELQDGEPLVLWTFKDDEGGLWESWDGHLQIEDERFIETYDITAWQDFILPAPYERK